MAGKNLRSLYPTLPSKVLSIWHSRYVGAFKLLKFLILLPPVDLYLILFLRVSCCVFYHNLDLGKLITAANRGFYRAKELGRDRVVECEIELDSAISNEQ